MEPPASDKVLEQKEERDKEGHDGAEEWGRETE